MYEGDWNTTARWAVPALLRNPDESFGSQTRSVGTRWDVAQQDDIGVAGISAKAQIIGEACRDFHRNAGLFVGEQENRFRKRFEQMKVVGDAGFDGSAHRRRIELRLDAFNHSKNVLCVHQKNAAPLRYAARPSGPHEQLLPEMLLKSRNLVANG